MRHFELYEADQVDQLVRPENFQKISADSPATVVFTDFTVYEPLEAFACSLKISD